MKTIIRTSLIFIFFLIGLAASAQQRNRHFYYDYVRFRPKTTLNVRGGLSFANVTGYPDQSTNTILGFAVGASFDWQFAKNWYLDLGLIAISKGAKMEYKSTYETPIVVDGQYAKFPGATLNAVYLQIPFHFGYRYQVSKMVDISLHAGPYIACGLGGQLKLGDRVEIYDTDWNFEGAFTMDEFIYGGYRGFRRYHDTFSDSGFKRLDFGAGLGFLLEYNDIGLGVNYDFGLTNISQQEGASVKNKAGYVTLGYRF